MPKTHSITGSRFFKHTESIQDAYSRKDPLEEHKIYIEEINDNKRRSNEEIHTNDEKNITEDMHPSLSSINEKKNILSTHSKYSNANLKHINGLPTEDIVIRINYIYEKFIKPLSDYELNLTANVITDIKEIVDNINNMTKNHETISIISLTEMNFDTIFDKAYDQIFNSLYLNVYLQYVVKKQSKKESTN